MIEAGQRMTREMVMDEVVKIVKQHGYRLTIFAVGNRTGSRTSPIDFMPDSHTLVLDLVEAASDADNQQG